MDSFWNKEPSAFNLIRGLFYILLPVIVLAIVLLFVLEINDTKLIRSAQIVAENTPMVYQSPFEAQVRRVYVKQSAKVKIGDTLMILYNPDIQLAYDQALSEVNLISRNIESSQQLLDNLQSRLSQQKKQKGTIKNDFDYQKQNNSLEVEKLGQQLPLMKDKLSLSKKRLDKDYILLQEAVISEATFNKSYKVYLEEQQRYIDLQKQYEQKRSNSGQLSNSFQSKVQEQQLNLLSSEQEYFKVEQSLLEAEVSKLNKQQALDNAKQALVKQYILADISGEVSYLYNTLKSVNYVPKGTKLVEVKPQRAEEFYARLQVPQVAMANVEIGQLVHLKLQAYDHFKYGVLKGKIKYITENDSTPDFQIMAQIVPNQKQFDLKSGYQANGEIILQRVK
ncbi:MAG: HlyD family secretion protein, partial [Chitinophagales bacterium]